MKIAVYAYPIQRRDGEHVCLGGVEMPIRAEPFALSPVGNGALGVLALTDPDLPVAWHPLFILPAGVQFDRLIGRPIGPFIGYGTLGNDAVFVFPCLPWPQSALEATPTVGTA